MNKCLLQANIYHDDLKWIEKNDPRAILFYKNDHTMTVHFNLTRYKLKLVDDTVVLTIKPYVREKDKDILIDVDLMSKYRRLKNRGCEDLIKNYSKNNTIKILTNTYQNYHGQDLYELLYLYLYLYINCVLLKYIIVVPVKKTYNLNKIDVDLVDEVEDLYNLLYVHFNLI